MIIQVIEKESDGIRENLHPVTTPFTIKSTTVLPEGEVIIPPGSGVEIRCGVGLPESLVGKIEFPWGGRYHLVEGTCIKITLVSGETFDVCAFSE